MKKKVNMYLNPKQLEFLQARQKDRTAIWGRGTGKSHLMGVSQRIKAGVMPRSKGAISSTTYAQLLTKTWAGIEKSWKMMGMVEGRDYVFGIRPPKHFDTPLSPVKQFGNTVHLKNGRMIEFLSMDRPDSARGGSYDDLEIDEMLLVKREHYSKVLLPAVRGNLHRFSHTHWHHSKLKFTSMPWKSSGLYLLEYRERAKLEPEKYFYSEATAYDNIHILGEAGIQALRDELTYLEFQMEVMNVHMIMAEEAFYDRFNDTTHTYEPAYQYGNDDDGRDVVAGSLDVNPDAMLEGSFDFGGWFSCCALFQEQPHRIERMVAAVYAKQNEDVKVLVRRVVEQFPNQRFKYIRLWGEPRGHDRQAVMTDTMYDVLVKEFASHGWTAEIMAPAKASRMQVERQAFMATILAEDTRSYPRHRMNQDTCKWAIIAIQGTQKLPDGKKDKRNEKDRNFPQEHATHITDAIDYYYDQKWGPRLSSMGGSTLGQAGEVIMV